MPETEGQQQQEAQKQQQQEAQKPTGKIVSAGKPEAVAFIIPTPGDGEHDPGAGNPLEDQIVGAGAASTEQKPAMTDEQVTAYLEAKGIKIESLEKLKEKVNYVAPVELTEEEKTKATLAKEKRDLDLFVKGKGTVEQYVSIKKLSEGDAATEVALNTIRAELKEAGFDEDRITTILKNDYGQITEDDIEQEEDETEKEFLKRKKEYGAKQLANRSTNIKTKAQQILAELTKAADLEESEAAEEKALSLKIEEQFQKLPRKMTLELGKVNDTDIAPIEYEVSESDLQEVKEMLQDADKRNNFFFNKDGSLHLTNLAEVLTRNKMLESAVQKAYHEGGDRQITEFRKTFPANTAGQLGVGGSSDAKKTGQKGKLVSWSKPVVSGNLQHTQ